MYEISEIEIERMKMKALRWNLEALVNQYLKTDVWKVGNPNFRGGYNAGAIDVAEQVNELLKNKSLK